MSPNPGINPIIRNVVHIPPDRPSTEAELRAIFPGDVDAVLWEIIRLSMARKAAANQPATDEEPQGAAAETRR
jgi:hypothetical protein